VPFAVPFEPFQYPDAKTPTLAVAAMRAVADTTHLPRAVWATVEPCDAHGWPIGRPLDVRITRDCVDVAAPCEAADA
jgi:hypothetical protein